MDPLLFSIGIAGNVISVLVFASPILETFRVIIRNRSTEHYNPLTYVATLLNASLWVFYGVTKPDGLLVATVNAVGVLLEAIYVLLFLLFPPPANRVKTALLVAGLNVGVFGAVFLLTMFTIQDENLKIYVLGIICACLNVLMYASPLSDLSEVVRTNSVEFKPFYLSLFLFLNGAIWTAYAILARDVFILIPNGIGVLLGSIQLVIYRIYMNRNAPEENQQLLINPALE